MSNTNNMKETDKKKKLEVNVKFSALNPFIEDNRVMPTENEIKGKGFVEFGTRNQYPNYIWELYKTVPTLGSIINSVVDYAAGDEVSSTNLLWRNEKEITDFCRKVFLNLAVFNGCYINIVRSKMGNIAKLDVLDYRNVRSDKDNTMFYYSPDFSRDKSYGRCKCVAYPVFKAEDKHIANSVYYIKGVNNSTYSTPIWEQAQTACEMEKNINE